MPCSAANTSRAGLVRLDLVHVPTDAGEAAALSQLGPWKTQRFTVDRQWCVEQLQTKIKATDWPQARQDVRRFLKPAELPTLELWGKEFFIAQATKLA